ncbi:MAG: response regulator [Alphaproteobacteria bacterium]|jgi:two-component system, chemotaxis family, chemotaxis protein CheY|nr:response regulator [Alphaproteobacteria bacterium]MBT7942168.1 response regulator [Alphaproteobacteria bacterium]
MKNFDLSEMSALVVEKNHPMRAMLRGILRELGVQNIYDTATPEDGFDVFNHDQPDVVLVDWCPDFDGIGLLHKIRTDPESHNPFVPVIMVTAHSEVDRVIQARDAGMTEYLSKPISASRLYQRISSIVESKRAFVRASEFFGPDRRRKKVGTLDEERRSNAQRVGGQASQ